MINPLGTMNYIHHGNTSNSCQSDDLTNIHYSFYNDYTYNLCILTVVALLQPLQS